MDSDRHSPRRGFAQILAGTAVGQVLTFFALPFLSRIYDSDQFGVLTFTLSIVAILTPVALLGFDQAVLQPRQDREVAPIAFAGIAVLVVVAVMLSCVVAWGPTPSTIDPELRPFLALAVPGLLIVTGLATVLTQLAVRNGRYGSIGNRNTAQSIAITTAQLSFGGLARSAGFSGLVTGALIGTTLGAVLLAPYGRQYTRRVSLRECLNAVAEYWRFPLVFAPMTALTLLAQQTPLLFVIFYFGVAEGGQVGMAERLVAVPLALIGMAASSVFTGELSQALRNDTTHKARVYLKTSLWLTTPAILALLGLYILAPVAFPVFLGDGWHTAAVIAQTMAVVAATRMLANPVRSAFRVLGRARVLTLVESTRVLLLLAAIALTLAMGLGLVPSLLALYTALAVADVMSWVLGLVVSRQADSAPGSR
ncbi:oligosaccharide flippase family protein [Microbacterium hydrocarbonoxydans]|uniref:oligosaccharide flippase family protein n=1 Tax=Microbacterium hydrocarbonoxydans TaxID=273678 RepID=UPI001FBB57CD|nr:lipopolysaccharide biosynthesis protein [Microbacterium hydrocarbonoxydans]